VEESESRVRGDLDYAVCFSVSAESADSVNGREASLSSQPFVVYCGLGQSRTIPGCD